MKKINEDFFFQYFVDNFDGISVRFKKNKMTGELTINADDVCKVVGIADNFTDFLSTDKGLDFINDWKREHSDMPFFGTAVKKTEW